MASPKAGCSASRTACVTASSVTPINIPNSSCTSVAIGSTAYKCARTVSIRADRKRSRSA